MVCLLVTAGTACGSGDVSNQRDQASGVAQRETTFTTSDGIDLTGRVFGRGKVGVVLSHMYPSDAKSWYPAAEQLASAGYMALAFNFRGYADSDGEKAPSKAALDVRAGIAELKERGARDIALVGASMGGTASIVAAEDRIPLAVVAISAPARFMTLDAIANAQIIQRPVLLVAARGDDEAFSSLQELERALPNPDTKIYEGEAHGTALLDDRPEALDQIISFLQRYAPTDGRDTSLTES